MAHRALWTCIAFAALLLIGTPATAQFPDKFRNLKVLPKDISKHELESTMRGFAFALGVRCDHCHVEKRAPEHGFDTQRTSCSVSSGVPIRAAGL